LKFFARDPVIHLLSKLGVIRQPPAKDIIKSYERNPNLKYHWRNNLSEGYKLSADAYQDKPLDLTNILLLKTREYHALNALINVVF
jgi:hypothetical protein